MAKVKEPKPVTEKKISPFDILGDLNKGSLAGTTRDLRLDNRVLQYINVYDT